jgi:hypothetical protein
MITNISKWSYQVQVRVPTSINKVIDLVLAQTLTQDAMHLDGIKVITNRFGKQVEQVAEIRHQICMKCDQELLARSYKLATPFQWQTFFPINGFTSRRVPLTEEQFDFIEHKVAHTLHISFSAAFIIVLLADGNTQIALTNKDFEKIQSYLDTLTQKLIALTK